jgi:hypothetical protein
LARETRLSQEASVETAAPAGNADLIFIDPHDCFNLAERQARNEKARMAV